MNCTNLRLDVSVDEVAMTQEFKSSSFSAGISLTD